MNKPERRGVQRLSCEFGLIWSDFDDVLSIRINGIANQRVADMRHVDAHLMRATGFQRTGNERRFPQDFAGFEMGDGVFALVSRQYRHFLAVGRRSTDLCPDRAGRRGGDIADDRPILALDVMGRKQLCQAFMRGIGFGDYQQAGGIAVDSVDDAGPLNPADSRQSALAVVKERVDQRAVRVA